MTRELVFTVDVDRDVNLPVIGRSAAGSIDRGEGDSPRFSSSATGLSALADLLDDMGMVGTFFVEGRTAETIDCSCIADHCIGLHGYDHEDLTGRASSIRYTEDELSDILRRGFEAVSDNVSRPVCFRAPYMSADERVLRKVLDLGIRVDSSFYCHPERMVSTYEPICGMTEFPVPKVRDDSGRTMAAYLWPMHEGKRPPTDYIRMAESIHDGPLVLATHSWHIVERRESGLMGPSDVAGNLDNLREVLEGIADLGFRPSSLRRRSRPHPSGRTPARDQCNIYGATHRTAR